MVVSTMARITVLDPHTVNKIAAGEVIERPASIVKELLDNSLDARATRITIDLESGGRTLLRVTDDGVGMGPEDLPLAVQNHATSKLLQIEDLLRIGTLGFRGEALASIAAVSRLTLLSREADAEVGHRIEVVDGRPGPARPVAAPRGTTVAVMEVFYNTPARREFLRSPAAERRAILDVVSTYALSQPQLRILLRDDGRELLDLRPAASWRERAADLLGRPIEQNLADVRAERESVLVEGLASKPPYGRNNRTQQFVFVNGRPVRDRTVLFAIAHAYRRTMEPDRFPVVVLFLALPPEHVDVNVHPTKREVRFRNERLLHEVVVTALRAATGSPEAAELDRLPQPGGALSVLKPWGGARRGSFDGLETAQQVYAPPAGGTPAPELGAGLPFDPERDLLGQLPAPSLGFAAGGAPAFGPGPMFSGLEPGASGVAESPLHAIEAGEEALYWQLHNAYLLVQIKGGMVLVDQHAAHERVLFDRAVTALEGRAATVQRLLFPITLELSVLQYAAFEECRDVLEKLGFQVSPFGPRSVLVEGIPAEMQNWNEGGVLLGMLDDVAENREMARLPLRDKVLATYACRAAIMMGKKLSAAEMRALMDQLFATTKPYTCPHGRPTLFRIGIDDLHRKFQR
jgi:DNA mismatch repair protein MutL